jgi:hypothetical protein
MSSETMLGAVNDRANEYGPYPSSRLPRGLIKVPGYPLVLLVGRDMEGGPARRRSVNSATLSPMQLSVPGINLGTVRLVLLPRGLES